MKKLLLIILLIPMLCSCQPVSYVKVNGEVVGKEISGGKYGDSYYINISYPISGGKFAIDSYNVQDKDIYNDFHLKDKVTVYANEDGIGEILK